MRKLVFMGCVLMLVLTVLVEPVIVAWLVGINSVGVKINLSKKQEAIV